MIQFLSRLPAIATKSAQVAAISFVLLLTSLASAASVNEASTPSDFVVSAGATAPDITAALTAQFGLGPEHAKAIAELYAMDGAQQIDGRAGMSAPENREKAQQSAKTAQGGAKNEAISRDCS